VNSNLIEPQSHILSYPISNIISNSVLDILQQFAIYIWKYSKIIFNI
jgi:hypothetical protein